MFLETRLASVELILKGVVANNRRRTLVFVVVVVVVVVVVLSSNVVTFFHSNSLHKILWSCQKDHDVLSFFFFFSFFSCSS